VKGSYCIVFDLQNDTKVRVGARGVHEFPSGIYAYVGSALSGLEKRVARHLRPEKKKRWHIDYLIQKGEVMSTIAVPSDSKQTECAITSALLKSSGARIVMQGFGSSDCACPTHLVYFGPEDPELVMEEVARTVAMLSCFCPKRTGDGRE
jgi:Uri superfamily endonuclease